MSIICVDLSRYQKGFNFAQFAKSGGLGVICKATEGTSIHDSCYKQFREEAIDAGLKFGSYHFFRQNDPVAQADYFLDFVKPLAGERVVCDFEDGNTSVNNMILFLQHLRTKGPNLQLTVYSGNTIKEQLGTKTNDWLSANTSLWLAQYTTTNPSWPKQVWQEFSLWQYSDKGLVPGFSGNVDVNLFNGSDLNFKRWLGPVAQPAVAQMEKHPSIVLTPKPIPATIIIPAGVTPEVVITIDSPIPITISLVLGENVTLASTDKDN